MNDSSQEEVSIRDVRILPNLNASYLPVMPDGSVLLVDNVWCVTDFVVSHDANLAFCIFKSCYAVVSVSLSCFCRSVRSRCPPSPAAFAIHAFCSASTNTVFMLLPVSVRSHQSGEVGMGSFCRVDSLAGRLPNMLSALEEHDFLFQLHLNDIPQDDSNEVRELLIFVSHTVPWLASWCLFLTRNGHCKVFLTALKQRQQCNI